jgi:hypothetical protein
MARLFEASGPFLSLYLTTSGDVENAGARVELRWKNGRSELLDRGVPEQLLEAVDPLVEGSHAGGATLAVVASMRVQELMQVVGGELPSIDAVLERAAELAAETAERDTGELLDRFEEERAQRDLAADGTAATFQALARSQVDVLLLEDRSEDGRTAWFGGAGQSVALDRDTLLATGEITPAEGRLQDVAVRAALLSGATVRVLEPPGRDAPQDPRRPSEGLGALLRFATP